MRVPTPARAPEQVPGPALEQVSARASVMVQAQAAVREWGLARETAPELVPVPVTELAMAPEQVPDWTLSRLLQPVQGRYPLRTPAKKR